MTRKPPRRSLDRDQIVTAAAELADAGGIDALSMRSLGRALGVEAMSLYHHVDGKEALLDAMVDRVYGEITLPGPRVGWRSGMRRRAESARQVLVAHPWAVALMDSRTTPGPATLRHHDRILGCLRRHGFSVADAATAFSLLDSYIFGYVIQELALPFTGAADVGDLATNIIAGVHDEFPNLAELVTQHVLTPGYDHRREFRTGLELILDTLGSLAK